MTENEKYIYDHFLISIKSGFESLDDVIDGALALVEDEGWDREISEDWIRNTFTAEYEKHKQRSASWGADNHPKKLLKAFDSLCKNGILALHNIGYTDEEAVYDTREIWQELEDAGISPKGYCYYSGQDLEDVINEEVLNIGFSGEKKGSDKESIAVGNIIKNVLENEGFSVDWKHTASDKIKVLDIRWENLYTSDEDVEQSWGHDRVFDLMR